MVSALNSSYIMKFSKHSSQVLQKCEGQSNDLPASGSKSSNTREACLRQRTSVHPCFADANPLYLERSPSASAVLPARTMWRDLCSQVLLTHLRHSSNCHPSQDDDRTPPEARYTHLCPAAEWHLSRAGSKDLGPELPTQTSGFHPCFEASQRQQGAKSNKAALQKGLCFSDSVHFTETKLALGWQEYDSESLFSYITMTLWLLIVICPLFVFAHSPRWGIQQCSRQVGILEHPMLCGHYSVFQLEKFCPDAPCSLHAHCRACDLRFPLDHAKPSPCFCRVKK